MSPAALTKTKDVSTKGIMGYFVLVYQIKSQQNKHQILVVMWQILKKVNT